MAEKRSTRRQMTHSQKPDSFFGYVRFFMQKFRLVKWAFLLVLVAGLALEVYLVGLAKTTDVSHLREQLSVSTTVVDQNGAELGTLSSGHGTYVTLDEISPNVQEAVISTEDKRFYHHRGFDIIGIGRAFVNLLVNRRISGGGSTLTQQLVKNSFLTNEQTLTRKLKELFISFEVEKTYSKDQILEMYLNNAYFGNGAYGVADASQKYFGKPASDLSLSEAAVLAGALKGPSIYNPVDDYERAVERRNVVLDGLLENEFIDDTMLAQAKGEAVPQMNNPLAGDSNPYQSYFDAVIDEAEMKFGISEEELVQSGYRITTYVNQNYQSALDAVYQNQDNFPIAPNGDVAESATVVLDPYSGGVLALVGGNEGYTFRGFNRGTQLRRQPGSVIKPLNVYTPALEAGYSPFDVVPDRVTAYGEEQYAPENYNHQSVGSLYLWQALAQSKNTTAVWLMNELGVRAAMSKLDAFGIPYTENDLTLASALGGLEQGVSPLQIASAYTTFINSGKRVEPAFIQSITDADGNTIVREQTPVEHMVVSPEIARVMTQMLLNVYQPGGTGAAAAPAGHVVAGKTGTVEGGANVPGVYDQWFTAYTPDLVVTSWYGFDRNSEEHFIWNQSPTKAAAGFKTVITSILDQSPNTPFDVQPIQADEQQGKAVEEPDADSGADDGNGLEDTINRWIDRGREAIDDFFKRVFG